MELESASAGLGPGFISGAALGALARTTSAPSRFLALAGQLGGFQQSLNHAAPSAEQGAAPHEARGLDAAPGSGGWGASGTTLAPPGEDFTAVMLQTLYAQGERPAARAGKGLLPAAGIKREAPVLSAPLARGVTGDWGHLAASLAGGLSSPYAASTSLTHSGPLVNLPGVMQPAGVAASPPPGLGNTPSPPPSSVSPGASPAPKSAALPPLLNGLSLQPLRTAPPPQPLHHPYSPHASPHHPHSHNQRATSLPQGAQLAAARVSAAGQPLDPMTIDSTFTAGAVAGQLAAGFSINPAEAHHRPHSTGARLPAGPGGMAVAQGPLAILAAAGSNGPNAVVPSVPASIYGWSALFDPATTNPAGADNEDVAETAAAARPGGGGATAGGLPHRGRASGGSKSATASGSTSGNLPDALEAACEAAEAVYTPPAGGSSGSGSGGGGGGPESSKDLEVLAQRFRSRPGRVPKAVAKLGPIAELAKSAANGKIKLQREELQELVRTVETGLAQAESEQKEDSRARNRVAQQRFRNRQRETISQLQTKVEEQEALIAELQAKVQLLEASGQR
ncbi:hypothetical protein HYH03_006618 [Edaphochlamys debaryana]|uniref:BZIP domain-containing protein n=1 Tax=Edaphochlamys debaryana TaxID=47281 RepID=A0A835YD62_9CHLO|nr:hypothetical protein HYH03_006618 [Edaphochlamys debaryana]|eukprot:KAG2495349.1 hypothetical protein HYH03_006618 [Edaphochlamys debaryana]